MGRTKRKRATEPAPVVAPPEPAEPPVKLDETERRALRALADRAGHAIASAGARRVVVVSARPREGRTRVVSELVPRLRERLGDVKSVRASELARLAPSAIDADVLVIDGPALLAGEGSAAIPDAWWKAIDGALVVVMARETREDELAEVAETLEVRTVPVLLVVWNELVHPPVRQALAEGWRRIKKRLAALPGRRAVEASR